MTSTPQGKPGPRKRGSTQARSSASARGDLPLIDSRETVGLTLPNDAKRHELRIELQMDDAADEEERASDTAKLRRRMLDLDVHDVKLASAGPPPVGARAAEVVQLGALIVSLVGSPSLVASIGHILSAWTSSRKDRSAVVQLGDRRIELTGISRDDQMSLLRLFEESRGE